MQAAYVGERDEWAGYVIAHGLVADLWGAFVRDRPRSLARGPLRRG